MKRQKAKGKIQRVGVLTSGGDGPGMNAAIRSVVRYGLHHRLQMFGIFHGYKGLIDDEVVPLGHRSVSNIIDHGGTMLKTAREPRMKTIEGQQKAIQTMKKYKLDALVVIGGDGSYHGAYDLYKNFGVPIVGLPGTIDNDIYGTDQTIGSSTAVDTALDAIDKIRDTGHSMERIFVVEVMGRHSGYIAIQVALGSGAENVIIPEIKFNYDTMYHEIVAGRKKGKVSWIVVVAEGAGGAPEVAQKITEVTGFETRSVVLGHIQRGGNPTAADRVLATRLGAKAVDLLLNGKYGKAVGVLQDEINVVALNKAMKSRKHSWIREYYHLVKILT